MIRPVIKFTYLIFILTIVFTATSVFAADIFDKPDLKRNEVIFANSSKEINLIDPNPNTNAKVSIFPGGRGPNQLIIYTSKFGDRTNTNEYGTEAIVQNNIVTMISGANSFIPIDGFVISGHGSAKLWMNKNITVGTKVFVEDNVLNVYTTSESYLFEAEQKISETKSMIDYYKGKAPNYAWKTASTHIEEAENYLKKAEKESENQRQVQKFAKLAIEEANQAMETVLPPLPNELKGYWIRPTEKTEYQIISTLNNMQDAGINTVFLETFYHGKTIFPSKTMQKYGFISQNELFNSFDPLKIWLREAHKRNMKVHIWFQSFYVGNAQPSKNPQSILAVHPEWSNKTLSDYSSSAPTCSRSEHNGYFLDPANPDVQKFLEELITEIICTYKPDGINLDYIRYPQAVSKNLSGGWGYTSYARKDFKDLYGKDPVEFKNNDDLLEKWNDYRRENITNFVRKIGTIGRQTNTYITAVIFPDLESALNTKQQDWRTWSKRNYINGFTPLFLTFDPKMVASMSKDVMSVKSPNTDIYAGIFVTFMGGSNEDLVRQIHEARKLKSNGIILFDYAHTTKQYTQMLSKSAFKPIKQKNVQKKKRKFLFFK